MQTQKPSSATILITPKERLAYIADMLGQLERMAAEGGHLTLAGILQVAAEEAMQAADLEAKG